MADVQPVEIDLQFSSVTIHQLLILPEHISALGPLIERALQGIYLHSYVWLSVAKCQTHGPRNYLS